MQNLLRHEPALWIWLWIELLIWTFLDKQQWNVYHNDFCEDIHTIDWLRNVWVILVFTRPPVLWWWNSLPNHDDVIKWTHFPRYWPFERGIHRSPVNSPHKGQWRGALMSSLICAWIDGWVKNSEADDLRRHRAHCDVTVMLNTFMNYDILHISSILMRNISRRSSFSLSDPLSIVFFFFLHAKPWIPRGEKSIFTDVIH